jgi:hypothetical protein
LRERFVELARLKACGFDLVHQLQGNEAVGPDRDGLITLGY